MKNDKMKILKPLYFILLFTFIFILITSGFIFETTHSEYFITSSTEEIKSNEISQTESTDIYENNGIPPEMLEKTTPIPKISTSEITNQTSEYLLNNKWALPIQENDQTGDVYNEIGTNALIIQKQGMEILLLLSMKMGNKVNMDF